MSTGSEAFFQVAVALIPALLFGGAVRRPERDGTSGHGTPVGVSIVVGLAVAIGVTAELYAIQGVIEPSVPRWKTRFVASTIVAGTVVIAAATVWAWLPPGIRSPDSGHPRIAIALVALAGLAAAVYFATAGLTGSLDRVDARTTLSRADGGVRGTSARLASADQEVTRARALLITTVVAMRPGPRRRFSVPVERGIHAIDRVVLPVLLRERPSGPQVKRVQAELLVPTARLRRRFYRHLGTERTDPEIHLAALAVDRLIQAENVRLVVKGRNAEARRTLERACDRVIEIRASEESLPGCRVPSG